MKPRSNSELKAWVSRFCFKTGTWELTQNIYFYVVNIVIYKNCNFVTEKMDTELHDSVNKWLRLDKASRLSNYALAKLTSTDFHCQIKL